MIFRELHEALRVEDNMKVILPGGSIHYYKILNRDQVFYRDTHVDTAIPALGGADPYTEITNLNPPSNEIIQIYKIKKDSNVQIFLKQPAPVNRWGTNRTPEGGPMPENELLDLWFVKNYPPQVRIVNNTDLAFIPVLKWIGWRYQVERLPAKPDKFTTISVTGIGGGL